LGYAWSKASARRAVAVLCKVIPCHHMRVLSLDKKKGQANLALYEFFGAVSGFGAVLFQVSHRIAHGLYPASIFV